MTNHDMLAFIYENGPCTHTSISEALNISIAAASFCCARLMLIGLIDFDVDSSTFFYSGDAWVAQP